MEFLFGDSLIAACFTRRGFESSHVLERIGVCGVFFTDFIALLRVIDLVCCDETSSLPSLFLLLYLLFPFLATKLLAKRTVWVVE